MIKSIGKYLKIDAEYVAKSSFWLLSGSALASLLSILLSIIIAKYVPKETFGIFKYIISMVAIAGALSLNSINTVVTRSVSQGYEGAFLQSIKVQLKWSTLQFIFLVLLAVYYFFKGNSIYGACFIVASICVPISAAANTYSAFLAGKKDFRRSSLYGFGSNALYVTLFGAITYFIPYTLPIVAGYFIINAIANIFFCIKTARLYKPNKETQPGDEAYAAKLSLTNAFGIVAAHIDSVIVYHFLGTIELAIYNFAIIVPDKIRALSGFIQTIALPKLSHQSIFIRKKIFRDTGMIFLFALMLMGLYVLFAPLIFTYLFPNYIASVQYSQLYSISLIAIPVAYLMTLLSAYKMQKQLYILNITMPILKIALLIAMIYFWGIVGAIIARILSIVVHFAGAAVSIPKTIPTPSSTL